MNCYNTLRDNSMSDKDFETALAKELRVQNLTLIGIKMLQRRYRTYGPRDELRVAYLPWLKDMQLLDSGISPKMLWATELAEDFIKALIVNKESNALQFLGSFCRTTS